jgi:transposase-like protein
LDKEGEPDQLVPSDLEAAKSEIKRLQKELRIAEQEREILKKALNIFSRENN